MEIHFSKNQIINEAKGELWHCFAYEESDIYGDAVLFNLKPLQDKGVHIANYKVHLVGSECEEPPIDSLLLVCTIPDFKGYEVSFTELCKHWDIEEKQVHILTFMAAIFTRTIHKLLKGTELEATIGELETYQYAIRPDLLELYIALMKDKKAKNGYKTAVVRFGSGQTVKLGDTGFPWFHYMMEEYLEKFLAVNSIEEAQEELEDLYPSQRGRKVKREQLYLNYIIASTYTYIARNIIHSEDNKVTVEQCRFLQDFLKTFHFLSLEAKENNLNNLQSTVRSLVIDSSSHVIERFRRNKRMKSSPREFTTELYWGHFWK